jgi:hypothetical protein
MFKIFITENNTTLEEMQKMINDLINNEWDSFNTPAIPNTLNTYKDPRVNYNFGNNVLFQYYDIGVNVYTKQEDSNSYTPVLFEIKKI